MLTPLPIATREKFHRLLEISESSSACPICIYVSAGKSTPASFKAIVSMIAGNDPHLRIYICYHVSGNRWVFVQILSILHVNYL